MTRLISALCGACACLLFGCIRYQRCKAGAACTEEFLLALEKLDISLQLSSLPLPDQLKNCAPDEHHYLYLLGEEMERSAALPMAAIMERVCFPPQLSQEMQPVLLQLMEHLLLPLEDAREHAVRRALSLWEKDVEDKKAHLQVKGKLSVQLSVLGGCALFILLC